MRKFFVVLSILLLGVLSSCFLEYKDPLGDGVKIDNLTQVDFNDSLKKNGPLTTNNLPSTGNVDVLVVPISFKPEFENPQIMKDINNVFNGSIDTNGYYSVSEFYKISSYGKLNLNFDVHSTYYKPVHNASFYSSYGDGMGDGSALLFNEVLTYLDNQYDYKQYDSDSDGFIDAVWMVYTHPVDFKNGNFWWAYVTNSEFNTKDNVKGLYYGFAGVDFIYPEKNLNEVYDTSNIRLDAHTFIHETGHLFGLDDYYDYDDNFSATYGMDYMDLNYGDHGPISKLLLDWVNPIIVNDVCDVTIKPYQTTGEVYLVTNNYHETIYDSYYMIINYSNDVLYKTDPYFKNSGILIYKVNASLNTNHKGEVEMNGGYYPTGFKYDNTDGTIRFVEILPSSKPSLFKDTNLLFSTNDSIILGDANLRFKVDNILSNNDIVCSFTR